MPDFVYFAKCSFADSLAGEGYEVVDSAFTFFTGKYTGGQEEKALFDAIVLHCYDTEALISDLVEGVMNWELLEGGDATSSPSGTILSTLSRW